MTLSDLRQYIQKRGYDAAIITRGNMFLGQDIRPEENELHRLTGFSGSAGTLLVLKDKAFLLVDGRYELQAACETDPAEIKANLIAQLTAPVRWTQSVQHMVADGATSFTELGPGKVLQGLVGKIAPGVEATSIQSL